jgi:hypothetical protein
MQAEPILVVAKVAQALEGLHVPYFVGGSLASSTFGLPRATQDVDLIADLRPKHVSSLVTTLGTEFHAEADAIRDAILRRSSFNLIHLPTLYKVDVFVSQSDPWAREEMTRRREQQIDLGADIVTLYLCSPEDTILHKLQWYRAGGGVSDRQWSDVLGVLKVQTNALDRIYLRYWAGELGLTELLEQAFRDAGQAS